MGGAPSLLVPYILASVPPDDYDAVVIDTLVNDATLLSTGRADPLVCERALFEGIEWLRGRGKPVVLLLLPQANAPLHAGPLRERRLEWSRARGVPVVDAVAVAAGLASGFGLHESHLFDDAQHAAWPVTLIAAMRLGAILPATPATVAPAPDPDPAPPPCAAVPDAAPPTAIAAPDPTPLPYAVVPLDPGSGRVIERATSLMRRSYAVLGPGGSAAIAASGPAVPLALGLNAARTTGVIRITAEDGSIAETPHLAPAPDEDPARCMIHALIGIPAPLHGTRFTVGIEGAQDGAHGTVGEIEAVLLRDATPEREDLWSGIRTDLTPGSRPVQGSLSPSEAAIGTVASILRGQGATTAAARIFRTRVASDPPLWERGAVPAARVLADLGESLGVDDAAERVLDAALARFPRNPGLPDRLRALRERRAARVAVPPEPTDDPAGGQPGATVAPRSGQDEAPDAAADPEPAAAARIRPRRRARAGPSA